MTGPAVEPAENPLVTTVAESFADQEAQCLGLDVPVFHLWRHQGQRSPKHPFWQCHRTTRLIVEYQIDGQGGGTWTLVVEMHDCRLRRGPAPEPAVTVRASSEDWLGLWSGRESVWSLIRSGRLSLSAAGNRPLQRRLEHQLPFLGVLGPLPDPTRDPVAREWTIVHRLYRIRKALWWALVPLGIGSIAQWVVSGWGWMLAAWAIIAAISLAVQAALYHLLDDRLGASRPPPGPK